MSELDELWRKIPGLPPLNLGKKCIYQVLGEYVYSDENQTLNVSQARSGHMLQLRARYEGLFVTEDVTVRQGHIMEIRSHLRVRREFHDSMTQEESFKTMQKIWSPQLTEVQDFPNIRALNDDLNYLCEREPSWTPDILALMQKR